MTLCTLGNFLGPPRVSFGLAIFLAYAGFETSVLTGGTQGDGIDANRAGAALGQAAVVGRETDR